MEHDSKVKNLAAYRRIARDKAAASRVSDDAMACANCAFAVSQRMVPTDLTTILVCRRFPPAMTQLPSPQGLQVLVQWPPVAPAAWCYEFMHRDIAGDSAGLDS